MAEKTENTGEPIIIKKYANRRLYNTAKSTYVTLEHLAEMVRSGQDFVVNDAKSGEDITRGVLAQIIFDEEAKGQTMLPSSFLRQLIRLYGDSLQGFVPGYLEASMETFSRNQEAMREQVRQAFEANPALANFEALARSNMEWFENALRMFAPFATGLTPKGGAAAKAAAQGRGARRAQEAARHDAGAARQARQGRAEPRVSRARRPRRPRRRAAGPARRRASVEIALQAIDPGLPQPGGVRLGLDLLGDGHHLEVAGQRAQAFHQHLLVARGVHAPHEGAVDLHHVEAEVAEVAEAGGAGAEVVQREGAARGAHMVHEIHGLARVHQRRVLGDLDDQPPADPAAAAMGGTDQRQPAFVPHGSGDMFTDSRRPGFAASAFSAAASASRSMARPSGPASTAGMKAPPASSWPSGRRSRASISKKAGAAGLPARTTGW